MKLSKVNAIFDSILNVLALLAAILLVFITLAVTTQVIFRYFLGGSLLWVAEITEYSLLFITFLAAAWLLRREGHVKMDLVLNRLKPGTQVLVNMTTSAIGAIICLAVVWYSAQVTWEHFELGLFYTNSPLNMPSGPIVAVVPIGSFLLFIQFVRRTYGYRGDHRAPADK